MLHNSLYDQIVKRYADFKNEKQVQSDFSSFTKNSTSGLFGYSAGQQENGQKGKTRQQRRKKNCQIKTPRKQISQYQDLQKKMSISIMTREGQDTMVTQALQQGLFQKQVLNYFKCTSVKVCVSHALSLNCFFPKYIL